LKLVYLLTERRETDIKKHGEAREELLSPQFSRWRVIPRP